MGAVAVGAAQVEEVVGQATAVVGVPAACEAVSQQARRAQPGASSFTNPTHQLLNPSNNPLLPHN